MTDALAKRLCGSLTKAQNALIHALLKLLKGAAAAAGLGAELEVSTQEGRACALQERHGVTDALAKRLCGLSTKAQIAQIDALIELPTGDPTAAGRVTTLVLSALGDRARALLQLLGGEHVTDALLARLCGKLTRCQMKRIDELLELPKGDTAVAGLVAML